MQVARWACVSMSRFPPLLDTRYSLIGGMLPRLTGRKGRPVSDARTMVEAIINRHRCGNAWHELPEVFGPRLSDSERRIASFGSTDTPESSEVTIFRLRSSSSALPRCAGTRSVALHFLLSAPPGPPDR